MQITPVTNNARFPVSQTVTSNGGKLLVQFAGSAWRMNVGPVSVNLLMDGKTIATASIYANVGQSHMALVPVAVLVPAARGTHTFTVAAASGDTKVDQNDFFTITVTESAPNYFEIGSVDANYSMAGWTLNTGSDEREWRQPVVFAKTFDATPTVTVGITALDIDQSANSRVIAEAQNITEKGFDLVYKTWSNTVLYGVRSSWLAFGDAQ